MPGPQDATVNKPGPDFRKNFSQVVDRQMFIDWRNFWMF